VPGSEYPAIPGTTYLPGRPVVAGIECWLFYVDQAFGTTRYRPLDSALSLGSAVLALADYGVSGKQIVQLNYDGNLAVAMAAIRSGNPNITHATIVAPSTDRSEHQRGATARRILVLFNPIPVSSHFWKRRINSPTISCWLR
jgi:hypothetical protein